MADAIGDLLRNEPRLWRARSTASGASYRRGLTSGWPELDRHLPGHGWPPHALTEILLARYGTGELKLLMPALARLSQSGHPKTGGNSDDGNRGENRTDNAGWIAWVAPPFQPYAPALLQWGVDISRMLIVRPGKSSDVLWAAEQALSCGNCSAVLLWSSDIDDASSRRLQLAAERGRSLAIAFRPLQAAAQNSAAALRIRLESTSAGTELSLLKSRGGRPVSLLNVTESTSHA